MKSLVIGTAVVLGTIGLGSASTVEAGHGHGHGHGHGGMTYGGYRGYGHYGHHHHHHHHPHMGYYRPMPRPVIVAPQPVYMPGYYGVPYQSGFGLQTPNFGLYIR
jgi:hypothetical protein